MIDLTISQIEAATISSWPCITSAMDGMWLARFARGYTKRSNSVQCLDPTDDADAPRRLERMTDLFLLNDREPIFRVTPLAGPGIIAALDSAGWVQFEGSRVLSMRLEHDFDEPAGLRVYEGVDANWIEAFGVLSGAGRRSLEILTTLVGLIASRNAGILLRDSAGEPVAAALAVNASGIGVFHCVVTRADARGKGFGRAVMHAALNWTRSTGADHAALQVVAGNAPAIALYTSLGFSEAYRYHYRRPQ